MVFSLLLTVEFYRSAIFGITVKTVKSTKENVWKQYRFCVFLNAVLIILRFSVSAKYYMLRVFLFFFFFCFDQSIHRKIQNIGL